MRRQAVRSRLLEEQREGAQVARKAADVVPELLVRDHMAFRDALEDPAHARLELLGERATDLRAHSDLVPGTDDAGAEHYCQVPATVRALLDAPGDHLLELEARLAAKGQPQDGPVAQLQLGPARKLVQVPEREENILAKVPRLHSEVLRAHGVLKKDLPRARAAAVLVPLQALPRDAPELRHGGAVPKAVRHRRHARAL